MIDALGVHSDVTGQVRRQRSRLAALPSADAVAYGAATFEESALLELLGVWPPVVVADGIDKERNVYICPAFNILTTTGKVMNDDMLFYRASTRDCAGCAFKARCCPKEPARKILRSTYEEARDVARALAKTEAFEQSCRDRKRVEMLFAHLKRILRLGRLRLRGPRGAQFEFTLAAIAQNLRRLARLMARPPPTAAACVA